MREQAPTGYLHQVDIVRLLTFASVIGVHSVAQTTTGDNLIGNGVEVFLHFTRDAFFTLTGFVLFHTNYRRPLQVKQFWRRRFPVVFVPYVVWSAIYFGLWVNNHNEISVVNDVRRFGYDLLTGSASYHLYFLLVSMQIYALFPAIRWVVQKTQGHHWPLLIGLFITDAGFTTWLHFVQHTGRGMELLAVNSQELFTTYVVFVFAGALAAVHLSNFDAWIRRNVAGVVAMFVAGIVLAETVYAIEVHHGEAANFAADPLQPSIMIWSLSIVALLYVLGLRWAQLRKPGRTADVVSEAARASFGVYLVHPLILVLASNLGFRWNSNLLPPAAMAVGAWVIAVVLSAAFVEVFLRTPLAMPLTGRFRAHQTQTNPRTSAP